MLAVAKHSLKELLLVVSNPMEVSWLDYLTLLLRQLTDPLKTMSKGTCAQGFLLPATQGTCEHTRLLVHYANSG